tara:strand:+ start:4004 stop:4495 length:492 start_codon:yes stop_codon:yes gene_type:complete
MRSFKRWEETLNEGKVTIAKLRPGLTVTPMWKGRSAKNYGISGMPVYDGKVKVLGMGIVPFGKKADKRMVIGKDYKDLQTKYKDIWKSDEIQYGRYWNARNKMKAFFSAIAQSDKKLKDGWVCWIWEVVDGPDKGMVHYCFIDSDDRWSIAFLNKSAEFEMIT